jgi:hypothetical protein
MMEAGKERGNGERERGWIGESHNSLPHSAMLFMYVMLSF